METVADLKNLYDQDEQLWLLENAKLLREGRIELADTEHIADTLEDMGKREYREITSRLKVLIVHLMKWIYQPEARSGSWRGTIRHQRDELSAGFDDSKNLRNHAEENFLQSYEKARKIASDETGLPLDHFPEDPHFSFEQTIDENYLPE